MVLDTHSPIGVHSVAINGLIETTLATLFVDDIAQNVSLWLFFLWL